MATLEGLLAAVEADCDACLPLSDWLEESGHAYEATLLRRRYRRWQGESRREAERSLAIRHEATQRMASLRAMIEANGGRMSYEVKIEDGSKGRADASLRAYVRRLAEGLKGV